MCKQNKTKFVPGKFDLNSIATQNTQTACTLQLLVKPFGLGGGKEEKGKGMWEYVKGR